MRNEPDLSVKKPSRNIVAREIKKLKSWLAPIWVKELRKHIYENRDDAVAFTENATTKHIKAVLDKEVTAKIKMLKSEARETHFLRLQGVITGLESVLTYIGKIEFEINANQEEEK